MKGQTRCPHDQTDDSLSPVDVCTLKTRPPPVSHVRSDPEVESPNAARAEWTLARSVKRVEKRGLSIVDVIEVGWGEGKVVDDGGRPSGRIAPRANPARAS